MKGKARKSKYIKKIKKKASAEKKDESKKFLA